MPTTWKGSAKSVASKKLLSLSAAVLLCSPLFAADTADGYFHHAAESYVLGNMDEAKAQVQTALRLFPADEKIRKLAELFQEQEKSSQSNKDEEQKKEKEKEEKEKQQQSEQNKKDEQQKQDQQQKQQQDQQEQQQKQDQAKQGDKQQDQQAAQDQRGKEPDQAGQAAQYGKMMQMTPQQAMQLLEAQKTEEKAMVFIPQNVRTNKNNNRITKDW